MQPARQPRPHRGQRLLAVDPRDGGHRTTQLLELPTLMRAGDLLVLNDAATLPASLQGRTGTGEPVEVRLAGQRDDATWRALAFGAGDWRVPTERRPPPPALVPGSRLVFGGQEPGMQAEVVAVHQGRVVDLRFADTGAAFWQALYAVGRPVQYSYLAADLPLAAVQTPYAARPWAVEMPSAGRPLTWDLLRRLRDRGVHLATLTHAAGLSSTGDDALDATLPWPERYDLPQATVAAVRQARAGGGRVLAAGTTVVRALEANALDHGPALAAGTFLATLRIGHGHRLQVVDGLLSGMHAPESSHYGLLEAFAPAAVLHAVTAHATAHGFLEHEFGDSCLILDGCLGASRSGPVPVRVPVRAPAPAPVPVRVPVRVRVRVPASAPAYQPPPTGRLSRVRLRTTA